MSYQNESNQWLKKVEFLSEFLPYMHQYNGSSIVIKYGGHAMTNKEMQSSFAKDIALLQQVGTKPVLFMVVGHRLRQCLTNSISKQTLLMV